MQTALALFLQLWLAVFALAAPIAEQVTASNIDNSITYGTGGGIVGFIVLILDIIVWMEVLKSTRPTSSKILWCLLVFIFPVVGVIIYYVFSNRQAHRSDYEALPQ